MSASAVENTRAILTRWSKPAVAEIPGIGTALAAIIEEIYHTGECGWQQLLDGMPPGVIELSTVPGLSLKKITALHDALGIESVADLKTACQEGLVSKVKGFGLKSQAKLLSDIESLQVPKDGSLLLSHALETAERILKHLRAGPELIEADLAGALRRRKETVRRISIVGASNQPAAVLDRFLRFPALAHTDELDETRCLARLAGGLRAELTVVAPEQYVAALHARTGSRRHIVKLRELARAKAMSLYPELPDNHALSRALPTKTKSTGVLASSISRRKCAKMKVRLKSPAPAN